MTNSTTQAAVPADRPLTGRVPADAVKRKFFDRLPPEILARIAALPDLTANLSDALDHLGLSGAISAIELPCQLPNARMVGQAVTARNVERRENVGESVRSGVGRMGEHEAYNLADPGDVVVIQGLSGVSNMGGQSAMVASRAGCAGAVIDGSYRDPGASRELEFPIWSRGATPITGKWRLETVEINGAVRIAGVGVHAGDIVAADEAGVVFVAFAHVRAVLAEAERISGGDTRQQADIKDGISLSDLATKKYK